MELDCGESRICLTYKQEEIAAMTQEVVHFRRNEAFAICDAPLAAEEFRPSEVNEETEGIVTCRKCRELLIAPSNIDHGASNFML